MIRCIRSLKFRKDCTAKSIHHHQINWIFWNNIGTDSLSIHVKNLTFFVLYLMCLNVVIYQKQYPESWTISISQIINAINIIILHFSVLSTDCASLCQFGFNAFMIWSIFQMEFVQFIQFHGRAFLWLFHH